MIYLWGRAVPIVIALPIALCLLCTAIALWFASVPLQQAILDRVYP